MINKSIIIRIVSTLTVVGIFFLCFLKTFVLMAHGGATWAVATDWKGWGLVGFAVIIIFIINEIIIHVKSE